MESTAATGVMGFAALSQWLVPFGSRRTRCGFLPVLLVAAMFFLQTPTTEDALPCLSLEAPANLCHEDRASMNSPFVSGSQGLSPCAAHTWPLVLVWTSLVLLWVVPQASQRCVCLSLLGRVCLSLDFRLGDSLATIVLWWVQEFLPCPDFPARVDQHSVWLSFVTVEAGGVPFFEIPVSSVLLSQVRPREFPADPACFPEKACCSLYSEWGSFLGAVCCC